MKNYPPMVHLPTDASVDEWRENPFHNAGLVWSRIGCGIRSVVANLDWL